MKTAPTLVDELYRSSFDKVTQPGWTDNAKMRNTLHSARRFVLDNSMSEFMVELAVNAFSSPRTSTKIKLAEQLRLASRLPHQTTWIEYDLHAYQKQSAAMRDLEFDPTIVPRREGWLLRRHPSLDTAFTANIFSQDSVQPDKYGYTVWTFPTAFAWTVDHDTIMPWRSLPFGGSSAPSEIATGIYGYKTQAAGIVFSDLIHTPNMPNVVSDLLREWVGVVRRMWALLATINDLPTEVTEVRASKGFMGRRNYRKFLDHKTITLTVPTKLYRKTARSALATVHRRGGPVREHWRRDWRRPLSPLCDHDWGADEKHMFCNHCKGRKIWINEHVRGDTSKGFVTHSYQVTHEP